MKILFLLIGFYLTAAFASSDLSDDSENSKGMDLGNGWVALGDIRAGWLDYDYSNPAPAKDNINKGHTDSEGFYVIPKLSILSPKYNNTYVKATVAAATDFGLNNHEDESRNFVFDSTDNESYAILQELYLSYEDNEHKFLIGREEIITPMIDTDDWYMFANSFELAYYKNNSLKNTTFYAMYFNKMAGVWDSGDNGTEFHSMSDASFVDEKDKKNADDSGVITLAFEYNDEKNNNLKVWNYYATDLYNTLFMQYDWTDELSDFSYDFGLQVIDFKEVGDLKDNDYTHIDYTIYSARFDVKFKNGFDIATGIAKYTDGEGQGATLGAWGAYPYFANGMIFHFFEAGSLQNAASAKAQLGFDLAKLGLKNTWIGYRYTYFDLDSDYSFAKDSSGNQDFSKAQSSMSLNGVRISYAADNGIYFTGTYEHVDLDCEPTTYAIRLIGGYKF